MSTNHPQFAWLKKIVQRDVGIRPVCRDKSGLVCRNNNDRLAANAGYC